MSRGEVHWERLSFPRIDAAAQAGAIVILPVGSVEQHGPHLPTGTDADIAEHVVQAAVEQLPDHIEVLIAPAVRYGYSHDHLGFPGTLSIPARLLEDTLTEIGGCILRSGFDRLAFVNGHGSNASLLYYVVRRVHEIAPHPVRLTAVTYWTLARDRLSSLRRSDPGGMGHACELETSLMLHYEPDTVDMSAAVREVPRSYSQYRAQDLLIPGPAVAPDRFLERTKSGVQGDPLVASGEQGQRFAEAIAMELATFLEEFASWPMPTEVES